MLILNDHHESIGNVNKYECDPEASKHVTCNVFSFQAATRSIFWSCILVMLVSYSSGQSKIRLGSWHNCTRYPNLLIRSNKQSNAETSSKLPEMSMQACFPKQGLALLHEEAFATSPSPAFQYSLLLLCWRWRFPRVRNSKCILATWTSPAHPCYILHIWTQSPHRSEWLDTWLAPGSELLDRRIGNFRLRAFGLPHRKHPSTRIRLRAFVMQEQGAKGGEPSWSPLPPAADISKYER